MQYMLLIYSDENCWTEEEMQSCFQKSMRISEGLAAQGKLVSGAPLDSIATATSLRVRDGKGQITMGPFAENNERRGDYYIADVENLDEALEIAARLPPAEIGTVEVKPLFPLPQTVES